MRVAERAASAACIRSEITLCLVHAHSGPTAAMSGARGHGHAFASKALNFLVRAPGTLRLCVDSRHGGMGTRLP